MDTRKKAIEIIRFTHAEESPELIEAIEQALEGEELGRDKTESVCKCLGLDYKGNRRMIAHLIEIDN